MSQPYNHTKFLVKHTATIYHFGLIFVDLTLKKKFGNLGLFEGISLYHLLKVSYFPKLLVSGYKLVFSWMDDL